jgi:hypothetical protein
MVESRVEPVLKDRPEEPRPNYEPPRIQAMSEREILNTFQITQAMSTWWAC